MEVEVILVELEVVVELVEVLLVVEVELDVVVELVDVDLVVLVEEEVLWVVLVD